jgi:hypothetical protein
VHPHSELELEEELELDEQHFFFFLQIYSELELELQDELELELQPQTDEDELELHELELELEHLHFLLLHFLQIHTSEEELDDSQHLLHIYKTAIFFLSIFLTSFNTINKFLKLAINKMHIGKFSKCLTFSRKYFLEHQKR